MFRVLSANLLLQALTLASKALLLFVLARYLSASDVGAFGIVAVTLSLGLHLVGLDFYAFSTREILARDPREAPRLMRDQLLFHLACQALALPALLMLFAAGLMAWRLAGLFVALLVAEQLAGEVQRLLFTLGRPVRGAAIFFVRGGAWIYALWALMAAEPGVRSVEAVLTGWIAGDLAGLCAAGFWLRDLPWRAGFRAPVDRRWLRRGLAVSLPLLGSTLAYRGMLAVDRYALLYFHGEESVGIYTFYANVRNAIQGFLEAGVLFVLRPRIIAARQARRLPEYRSLLRRLTWTTGGLALALGAGAALLIRPVIALVGNPIYGLHLGAYYLVLAAALAAALGEIPHTALYARHLDRAMIAASLAGLAAALVLNLLLTPRFGVAGSALATLIAVAATGILKSLALRRAAR